MSEVTTTPTTVAYRDEGFLAAGISASATTITVGGIYKSPSGVRTLQGFDSTKGYAEISYGDRREVISFGAASVNATTKVTTLTDVRRGLPQTNTTANFTAGTGLVWPKGATIRVIDYTNYIHQTAFKDIANTFTEDQTIESGNKVLFGDSDAYVYTDNGGTDLKFKDANNSEKTLSELSAAGGSDEKVAVTSDDTTPDYLLNKLAAGTGITLTETNGGGNEDVTIAAVNTVATGHTGLSSVTTGGLLVGAGTSNMTIIGPGSSGQVPLSNGTTIAMADLPMDYNIVQLSASAGSAVGTSTTSEVDAAPNYAITGGSFTAVGQMYKFDIFGEVDVNGATCTLRVKVGTTTLATFTMSSGGTTTDRGFYISGVIMCKATGGSGSVQTAFRFTGDSPTGTTIQAEETLATSFDTTASNTIQVSAQYNGSNSGNAMTIHAFNATKVTNS